MTGRGAGRWCLLPAACRSRGDASASTVCVCSRGDPSSVSPAASDHFLVFSVLLGLHRRIFRWHFSGCQDAWKSVLVHAPLPWAASFPCLNPACRGLSSGAVRDGQVFYHGAESHWSLMWEGRACARCRPGSTLCLSAGCLLGGKHATILKVLLQIGCFKYVHLICP